MLLGLCLHITLGWFLYFQAEAVRAEVPSTEAEAQEAKMRGASAESPTPATHAIWTQLKAGETWLETMFNTLPLA